MRLLLIKNGFRCTEAYKGFQHQTVAAKGILDGGIELAVGKCSGTALPELYVGLGL